MCTMVRVVQSNQGITNDFITTKNQNNSKGNPSLYICFSAGCECCERYYLAKSLLAQLAAFCEYCEYCEPAKNLLAPLALLAASGDLSSDSNLLCHPGPFNRYPRRRGEAHDEHLVSRVV